MALSTRELLLVLRVSDRTGGALRRVSRDIGALGTKNALQGQIANQAGILKVAQARAADIRQQSLQATMTLRNMRLQQDAAASAIASMKQLEAMDAQQTIALREQTAQYERLTAAIATQTDVAKKLRTQRIASAAAADAENAKLGTLQGRLNALNWTKLERGAQLLEHLGRVAAIGGTIGTLALGASAKSAADLQTSLTLAASQARRIGAPAQTTLNISKQLMTTVLDQMKQFPAASSEMANSLYEIFSGTNIQKPKAAAAALKIFNEAAVAGGADLGTMTQAGISLINNFEKGSTTTKKLTDNFNLFFSAVRYGRMNASQFASSFSNILPVARAAGLTFKDVADAMAFLTRQTGAAKTSSDATGLARLIDLFSRASVEQALFAKGIDITTATGKLKPLVDIITEIQDKLHLKPGVELNQFFKNFGNIQGTAQARRQLDFLVTGLAQYQKVASDVNKDNTEFSKSFEALSQAPGVRWKVFTNQLKALAIMIGSDLIPAFVKLGGYIQTGVKWFESLSAGTRKTIAIFALMVSVGALLGGTVLMIVGGLASLVITARTLFQGFGLLGGEAGAVNLRFAALFGIAGILITVLIKYPGVFHAIINAIRTTVDAMGGLHGVMTALIIAAGAFTLIKVITAITATGTAATVATGEITLLLTRLGTLAAIAIPAIVIPIVYHYGSNLTKAPVGQDKIKTPGGVTGFFDKLEMGAEDLYNRHVKGMTAAQSRLDIISGVRGGGISKFMTAMGSKVVANVPSPAIMQKYEDILNSPLISNDQVNAAALAIQKGDMKTLNDLWKITQIGMHPTGMRTPDLQRQPVRRNFAQQIIPQTTWNQLFENAKKLANIAAANPQSLKDQEKYYAAIDALQKGSTKNQFQAAQEVIGSLDSATKKSARDRAKISKPAFLEELANVIKLRNEYLKSGDTKVLQKFYDAKAALSKLADSAERAYLDNAVTRTNAAYKQMLANQKAAVKAQNQIYADALSNLTSMYQSFFQEQQTNFGNLFQGPLLSGQKMQVEFQWGYKTRPQDLLKDLQAQVFQYGRFNKLIGELSKRGAPKELVDQIRAAGPAAMQDIYDLTKMTPTQWRAYVAAFKKGQDDIKNNTMAQLTSQISLYRQHGQNIAKAIVAGITSEDTRLQSAIEKLLEKQFGIKPTASYKPTPHRTSLVREGDTVIHVHGHPADARTRAAVRHGLFRTRVHTSGKF